MSTWTRTDFILPRRYECEQRVYIMVTTIRDEVSPTFVGRETPYAG